MILPTIWQLPQMRISAIITSVSPLVSSPDLAPELSEYLLLSNRQSAALITRHGSVDWLCLPRFDSWPIFARILDWPRRGHWSITPLAPQALTVDYLNDAPIMYRNIRTPQGILETWDFMTFTHGLVRIVHALSGEPQFTQEIIYHQADAPHLIAQPLTLATAQILAWGLKNDVVQPLDGEYALGLMRVEQQEWATWMSHHTYRGIYQSQVQRSAMVLRCLIYQPTGAIVAAPTTSLPEWVGGDRNWDYRYAWLRDGSFAAQALSRIGYDDDAHNFLTFALQCVETKEAQIAPLYCIDGTPVPAEIILPWQGYHNSRPVRFGNQAAQQTQNDAIGSLLDLALTLAVKNPDYIDESAWLSISHLGQRAAAHWRNPDASIWESRNPILVHSSYSLLMSAIALDRCLRLSEILQRPPIATWQLSLEEIYQALSKRIPKKGGLKSSPEQPFPDPSLLRMSLLDYLPPTYQKASQATARYVVRSLTHNMLMPRWHESQPLDGIAGAENGFLLASFWQVQVETRLRHHIRANRLFRQLLNLASPFGLLAEEADLLTREPRGNYPQAFSHTGLIDAAVDLSRFQPSKPIV